MIKTKEQIEYELKKHRGKERVEYLLCVGYTNAPYIWIEDAKSNFYYDNLTEVLEIIKNYPNLVPGDERTRSIWFDYIIPRYLND